MTTFRQRRAVPALVVFVAGVGGVAGGVVIGAAACDVDGDEDDCVRLCDRTVLCVEKHVAPAIAAEEEGALSPDDFVCAFDDQAGARATCVNGCGAQTGPTARACVACLADRLSCSTTASMRSCDVDCEPTMFATGADGEGALSYDYASWFFTGVDELQGITCDERP